MKLKYLLRGIGIGAILATAIMYFIYGKSDNALSDDEIIKRARELGMMTVSEFQDKELNLLKSKLPDTSEIKVDEKNGTDEVKEKVSDNSMPEKNTPSKEGGEAGQSGAEGDNAGKTTEAKGNKTGTSEKKSSEKGKLQTGNTTTDKTKTTDTGNKAAQDGETKSGNEKNKKVASKLKVEESKKQVTKVSSGKVNFSITAGMSSEKVAASLKALGIIDNSTEFNKYLVSNGFADKIRVGKFEIQSGQSYAEIAAKITQ